jgi:predicted nuclease of predicted toxin-antitoxin system
MKLFFDQNLSFKLPPSLNSAFPGSKHVKDFDLTRKDDGAICPTFVRRDSSHWVALNC